ncbi:TrmB family transcriptional regulator [Catellatospora coxensis]
MLGVLGLDPEEEFVYRALLGRPSATAMLLADLLERPETVVEQALSRLVENGLALRSGGEAFVAAPPAMALGALITERRDGLRIAEQALVTLAEEHRAAVAGRSISELIEVVSGVDAIRHRFQQVQQAARTEIRNFVTAPYIAVPPGSNAQEDAAAARGVRFRVVLERSVLAQPGIIDEVVDSLERGVELRVADQLPMKLILADGDLALVPVTAQHAAQPGGEPGRCCCTAAVCSPRWRRCSRRCGSARTRWNCRVWGRTGYRTSNWTPTGPPTWTAGSCRCCCRA